MRTASSSGPGVGVSNVGRVGVGIVAGVFRVGGLPSGFTITGGIGWGDLAVVLQVQGVVLLAIGGELPHLLTVLRAVRLDEVLREEKSSQEIRMSCKKNE